MRYYQSDAWVDAGSDGHATFPSVNCTEPPTIQPLQSRSKPLFQPLFQPFFSGPQNHWCPPGGYTKPAILNPIIFARLPICLSTCPKCESQANVSDCREFRPAEIYARRAAALIAGLDRSYISLVERGLRRVPPCGQSCCWPKPSTFRPLKWCDACKNSPEVAPRPRALLGFGNQLFDAFDGEMPVVLVSAPRVLAGLHCEGCPLSPVSVPACGVHQASGVALSNVWSPICCRPKQDDSRHWREWTNYSGP
jgi:hypothetical protein